MQQIYGVGAQRGFGKTAGVFAIQKTIDPLHFTPALRFNDMERTSRAAARLMDHLECHGSSAASMSR